MDYLWILSGLTFSNTNLAACIEPLVLQLISEDYAEYNMTLWTKHAVGDMAKSKGLNWNTLNCNAFRTWCARVMLQEGKKKLEKKLQTHLNEFINHFRILDYWLSHN